MSVAFETLEPRRLMSGPGEVTFGGDVTFGGGSTLDVEIGGTQPGTQYDVVHVTGTATLDGTLRVTLLDGFVPQPGDAFQVLTFGSRAGDFAQYAGLDLGSGRVLRPLFSDHALSLVLPPAGGPRVTGVFVSSAAWSNSFKNFLQSSGAGSGQFGFAVPSGPGQLGGLPWTNANRVGVRFDRPVLADLADLRVAGARVADYGPSAFAYDAATNTATWTLARPLDVADRVALDLNADPVTGGVTDLFGAALDGEWSDGLSAFPSGNAAPGGNLHFGLRVVPGDVDRNGRVDALDELAVRQALLCDTTNVGGAGVRRYTPFVDVDGDGSVLLNDFTAVRARLGSAPPPPVAATLFCRVAAARSESLADALLA
jgi:hypothetical protein